MVHELVRYMKLVNMHGERIKVTQLIYIWKLIYMFLMVSPPIIRSTQDCIYSIWYLSNRHCYLPLSWKYFHDSGR